MAHRNGFVVSIRSNGKIARETRVNGEDQIHLPFGSDYSILLKNLESRKAVVKISIDGKDAGCEFLVPAGQESVIEGFLDMDTWTANNAFRFIRKTKEISDFRGDRIDDGLVRVEVTFEAPKKTYPHPPAPQIRPPWEWPSLNQFPSGVRFGNSGPRLKGQVQASAMNMNTDVLRSGNQTLSFTDSTLESGITVPGAVVNQKFTSGYVDTLESTSTVFVFRLVGEIESKPIQSLIATTTKFQCQTCGRRWGSDMQFCGNCGTNLRA